LPFDKLEVAGLTGALRFGLEFELYDDAADEEL
jgi:hypothetical protein